MRRLGKKLVALVLAIVLAVLGVGCIEMGDPEYITVTTDETIFDNRYFYSLLSGSEKILYQELYQGLNEQLDEFAVHCSDGDESNRIFYMVLMDFPELFWPDGNIVSTAYNNTYTTIEAEYSCTPAEREQKQREIQEETDRILNGIPAEYSEYEKIKYVYEYIVNSVEYKKGAPDNQNMYSALVNKASVCAGYAKATQYLLQQMDIYCIYVLGEAKTENQTDAHAWNIVKCNGEYYCVDTTWGDPLFMNADEQRREDVVYDYLCCSDQTTAMSHTPDAQYTYPACTSDDLNYYRLNNMYYSSADRNALTSRMLSSIDAKEEYTVMKFSDARIYSQAKDLLVNTLLSEATQYLGRKYGISKVICFYSEDERLNKFVIYWNYQ